MSEKPEHRVFVSTAIMLAIADAAKLSVVPTECPHCHMAAPWLQISQGCAECRCCGWTGYFRLPPDPEPLPRDDRSGINRKNVMKRWRKHTKLTPS